MTVATDETRYVARGSGPTRLAALPPPVLQPPFTYGPPAAPAAPTPPETMTTPTTTTKKTKAKPRSKTERARILAELTVNGGTLTAGESAAANGVSTQTIYAWQAVAKKKRAGAGTRSGKKRRSNGSSATAAPAPAVTNGHTPAPDDLGKPTIELRGLREWVNQAVAAELKRRFW